METRVERKSHVAVKVVGFAVTEGEASVITWQKLSPTRVSPGAVFPESAWPADCVSDGNYYVT